MAGEAEMAKAAAGSGGGGGGYSQFMGPVLGGIYGLLKTQEQQRQAEADRELLANLTRYSPWTRVPLSNPIGMGQVSPLSNIASGTLFGAEWAKQFANPQRGMVGYGEQGAQTQSGGGGFTLTPPGVENPTSIYR